MHPSRQARDSHHESAKRTHPYNADTKLTWP
jgi:hypothetical protein